MEIRVKFRRDFQLMWPASIGTGYAEWNNAAHAYRFGADGFPYAAVLGSPESRLISADYATNYSGSAETEFSLGTVSGPGVRVLAVAGSMKSFEDAFSTYEHLIADAPGVIEAVAS